MTGVDTITPDVLDVRAMPVTARAAAVRASCTHRSHRTVRGVTATPPAEPRRRWSGC